MKSIDQLLGMPVVTLDEGLRLGKLKGVEIDMKTARLRYLHFDGERQRTDGLIPWEAVRSIGSDAVTIGTKAQVMESIAAADRDHVTPFVGDRPVVSESGERLGSIHSYDVDPATGQVVRFHIACGGFVARLVGRELTFPPESIRTFGRDAIIVADAVAHPQEHREQHAA